MTEREMIAWEMHEQGVIEQVTHLSALLASIPEDLAHHSARMKIVAATVHIENARDALAAARARMPKEGE